MDKGLENSPALKQLEEHSKTLTGKHLRELLKDKERNSQMRIDNGDILFDYSHEKLDTKAIELLVKIAEERKIKERFDEMFRGDKINTTEKRSVLHSALRMDKSESLTVDGVDVIKDVHKVLDQIKAFTDKIRNGTMTGFTGKKLKKFVSIGIGGSYLSVDFVYNALKSNTEYQALIKDFDLRFVANVCPIDFERATKDFDPEETLVIVISKTFTTAETMLNARNLRHWVLESLKAKGKTSLSHEDVKSIISKHFCAVSSNIPKVEEFGINKENVFGFWDWVGGRYSIWSAVGAVPLSLFFSFDIFEQFLKGGKSIDDSIKKCTDIRSNIPLMLGLLGFYNEYILNLGTRAILPYSQALCKFANHIQQLDMESNGKKVSKVTNEFVKYDCGAIVFGEPGTNGQHSFYQLIHQGRKMACEFIGVAKPQFDVQFEGELVSSHVELMCNFFAQPDALAYGKYTEEDLKGIPPELKSHKTFQGDRCSISLMFKELNAFSAGQLLSIYENRVVCEGFIYDINSFDQWGVELGKVLAVDIRKVFTDKNVNFDVLSDKFNSGTLNLMKYFISNK